MSVPTHGVACRAWAFPTECRCGDDVFYFSCSCGSKVLFDDLGWPWPEHCCQFSKSDECWARSRPKKKLAEGGVQVHLSESTSVTRRPGTPTKWNIDPGVVDEAKRSRRSRRANPIEAVPPGDTWTVEIIGVVRELKPEVDVFNTLKLPRTEISRGFLGSLGDGVWGRMTIHKLKEVVYSYTAWVPSTLLSHEVRKGIAVSAALRRLDVPDKAREWVCEVLKAE